jgi:ribosomal protein S6
MDKEDNRLYEVGYLLVPTIAEDKVSEAVAQIRGAIEKAGGSIKTEEFPKFRRLAYEMRKKVDTKYETYDSAYFGFVVFDGDVDAPAAVKEGMDAIQSVLRYILVKDPVMDRLANDAPEEGAEDAEAASDAELDRSIDRIVSDEPKEDVKEA